MLFQEIKADESLHRSTVAHLFSKHYVNDPFVMWQGQVFFFEAASFAVFSRVSATDTRWQFRFNHNKVLHGSQSASVVYHTTDERPPLTGGLSAGWLLRLDGGAWSAQRIPRP